MACIRCGSEQTRRDGKTRLGGQRWRCNDCGRRFTARSASAFSQHAFPDDVIALAVRWYVRYRLSYADVVEWLAERGLPVDRSTIYRWVQRFLPLFGEGARAYRRPVGAKWRADELDTRLNGKWTYIERAIDEDGQVVDAYVSQRRTAEAAQAFLSGRLTRPRCDQRASRRTRPNAIRRRSGQSSRRWNIGAHGTSTTGLSATTAT